MLCMKNVSYSYRSRKILHAFDLCLEEGKIYAVYGPSGSGKTTCLALLGGLEIPDTGEILLDDTDIRDIGYSVLRKRYVSYVFQDFHLFPYMTAVENVMSAIDLKDCRDKRAEDAPGRKTAEQKEGRTGTGKQRAKAMSCKQLERLFEKRAMELLDTLGIRSPDQTRPVSQLSGGEQQRVAIARALITDSRYILADEPTGNLDAGNSEMIMGILQKLAHEMGKCVVVVTHSEQVRKMCDESIYLEKERES